MEEELERLKKSQSKYERWGQTWNSYQEEITVIENQIRKDRNEPRYSKIDLDETYERGVRDGQKEKSKHGIEINKTYSIKYLSYTEDVEVLYIGDEYLFVKSETRGEYGIGIKRFIFLTQD